MKTLSISIIEYFGNIGSAIPVVPEPVIGTIILFAKNISMFSR